MLGTMKNWGFTGNMPLAVMFGLLGLALTPLAQAQQTPEENPEECELVFGQSELPELVCASQSGATTGPQLFTFVNDLRTRVIQQRNARRIINDQGQLNASRGAPLGGAASADDDVTGVSAYGRLSPFVIGDFADADRERTSEGIAYDQDTESFILGADYRVNNTLFVGGTLSYLDGDTDFANDRGDIDVEAYILGLHGSKYWGNGLFMDGLVTYGEFDADITRNAISPFGGPTSRFTASPDGEEMSAEVALGYEYSQGRNRITPLVKLHYFDATLDGYQEETDSFGSGQQVSEQDFDSVNLQVALQADTVLLMGWGVLIPTVNLAYHHEFAEGTTTSIQGPFGSPTKLTAEDPDQHTFVLRVGASAQFTHGWSGFVSFEKLLHHDYLDRNNAVLGVRYEIF